MSDATNRAVVSAWGQANQDRDHDGMRRLAHPEYIRDWPQTGERMRGIEAAIAIDEVYPGGTPDSEVTRLTGPEDRWVVDASLAPRRILGSGDVWFIEVSLRYASGEIWDLIGIIELFDGLIHRETQYFAPHLEPPGWRAGLTERIPRESDRP